MTEKQIISLLKDRRAEVRDIENIPKGISASERAVVVEANYRLSVALGHIIDLIEGEESAEEKPKKNELVP